MISSLVIQIEAPAEIKPFFKGWFRRAVYSVSEGSARTRNRTMMIGSTG
jgi:hypothetical protein